MNEVIVAVFGDLGRSPRMINHTRELLKLNYFVHLIGYSGEIDKEITSSSNVKLHFMFPFNFHWLRKQIPLIDHYFKLIFVLFRSLLLFTSLIMTLSKILLFRRSVPRIMIIQTPPVLPLLVLSPLFCLISGTRLVIDCHNFGYTLIDSKHRFLRCLYSKIEAFTFKLCALKREWKFICVSKSMRTWIIKNFEVRSEQIEVLYDRPNEVFRLFSDDERRITKNYFFEKFNIINRNSLLFVSSTSWTPDEDFDILLDAIIKSDQQLSQLKSENRKIVLIITGKGPMRKSFETKVHSLRMSNFEIITAWLEPESYPKLLACADMGLSFHTSSSGLDLPMKVVDMLGSGLPVCAFNYECLSELLLSGSFGFLFRNSNELAKIFINISTGKESLKLNEIRNAIKSEPFTSWNQEWTMVFKKLIKNKSTI